MAWADQGANGRAFTDTKADVEGVLRPYKQDFQHQGIHMAISCPLGLVKVVFATGTLAAGINMPARSTIIHSISRRAAKGAITLRHNELMQMAGRAGRRGFDTEGLHLKDNEIRKTATLARVWVCGDAELFLRVKMGKGLLGQKASMPFVACILAHPLCLHCSIAKEKC